MWGPGLSAIICGLLFRNQTVKTITFFGTSIIKSLLFWGIPMVIFLIFGFKGYESSYLNFAIYMVGTFIFTLGEELGWRGFLQDQLNHLPKWKRYLIIGAMWELWHFTTRTLSGSIIARIFRPLLFIIPNTLLSWVLGESVNKSKSLIVAVTLHSWINILIEFNNLNTYIIFGLSVPFWTFMLIKWDKSWLWMEKFTRTEQRTANRVEGPAPEVTGTGCAPARLHQAGRSHTPEASGYVRASYTAPHMRD